MSHADDGTLNALLDGELGDAEAAEVRAHLASCAECAARFQDAQRFLDEAADLLGVLTLAAPPRRGPARRGAGAPEAGPGRGRAARSGRTRGAQRPRGAATPHLEDRAGDRRRSRRGDPQEPGDRAQLPAGWGAVARTGAVLLAA